MFFFQNKTFNLFTTSSFLQTIFLMETTIKTNRRPARCQLDPSKVYENSKPEQSGQSFNIWYSKWTGGETNGRAAISHAKHRCNVKRDSGYTKADRYTEEGQINRTNYFCLYFARGYCSNGKNCEYLHRIPTELDFFSPTVDCFGRERFNDYRDDMSGIGSFSRVNKTLYVGKISNMKDIEVRLQKSFGEFGEIAHINTQVKSNVAFITYKLESQAQFAKEAMHCQSINPDDNTEVLNIRWAHEDPNMNSKKRKHEDQNELSMDAAKKILMHLKKEQENKKQKIVSKSISNNDNDKNDNNDLKKQEKMIFELYKKMKANDEICGLVSGYSTSDDES